ncbi:hypothetical protein GH714_034694 [Hevea brasiliensis]|uniref:F-box associated beta-propeller type 1 domain-containing protein n=1 Tax=Hevea brasiliensis TaxID=3981 RepID=A0A6A6MGP4_HEVBR|nr:hypothetical protein GH714_034694 [Hevea brasiliensis]
MRKHRWMPGFLPVNFQTQVHLDDDDIWIHGTGYGFGYDRVSGDYKIVRILQMLGPDNVGYLESEMVICHVKTRVITSVKMPYLIRSVHKMGVFAGGALHWIMGRYDDLRSRNLIVGYDLGTDEFRELPQPEHVNETFRMHIGLLGTCLCMLAYHSEVGTYVWMMKEYGVRQSWTKLFSIPDNLLHYKSIRPLGFSKKGSEILLELNGKRLVWYDLEKKSVELVRTKVGDLVGLSPVLGYEKSFGGGMSVSKQWRATIDDPDFIKRQINHSIKTSTNNTLFIKEEYGQQFFDYDFDCSGSCVSMEFRDLPNSSLTHSVSLVGSSNGLICLRNESNDDILIVNPSTRKHRWMPGLLPLKFHSCVNLTWDGTGFRGSGYGFGYDRVSDDYKIVRIAQVHNPANDGFLESEVLICKVKTKIVRAVKIPFVVPTSHRMAVLVNEALHWIAFRYDDPRVSDVIVVYDLVTDEFREFPLPELVDE